MSRSQSFTHVSNARMVLVLGFALLAGFGCRQKMAEQPYYKPYEESDFFEDDHRSSRPHSNAVSFTAASSWKPTRS